MKRLRIPASLMVVTLAAPAQFSCSPRPAPMDASVDAVSERLVADVVGDFSDAPIGDGACEIEDVVPFPSRGCGRLVDGSLVSCGNACTDGTCPAGCRLCAANPFEGDLGFQCTRSPGSTTACPARVCEASECPTGCDSCQSPLFCIPDSFADGGRPESCDPTYTCSPMGCGDGCRAVG